MSPAWLRGMALAAGALLVVVALVLGWIAVIAARRSEGVFLPAGYVAAGCAAGGIALVRWGMRH